MLLDGIGSDCDGAEDVEDVEKFSPALSAVFIMSAATAIVSLGFFPLTKHLLRNIKSTS